METNLTINYIEYKKKEKMLKVTPHQGTTKQNHTERPPHTDQSVPVGGQSALLLCWDTVCPPKATRGGGSRALGNMDHQEQRGCNVAQGVPKLAQTWPISVIGALTGSRAPVGGRGGGWGRGLERAQTWVMIAGRSAHAYFWGWFWLLGYFSRAVLANVRGSSRDFTHIPALTEAQPLP